MQNFFPVLDKKKVACYASNFLLAAFLKHNWGELEGKDGATLPWYLTGTK